jgi:hypothetical protein
MNNEMILKQREALKKLKTAHDVYKVCGEEQKARLFANCHHLIIELASYGEKPEIFYETLLMYGEEFLLSEYGDEVEKLFGAFKHNMTTDEIAAAEAAYARQQEELAKNPPTVQPAPLPAPAGPPEGEKAAQLSLSGVPNSVEPS